jgi:tetratricopeptide (TPR) repeat protein
MLLSNKIPNTMKYLLLLSLSLWFCHAGFAQNDKAKYKQFKTEGDALLAKGELRKAQQAFQTALQHMQGDAYAAQKIKEIDQQVDQKVHYALDHADQLLQAGKTSDAAAVLKQTLSIDPENASLLDKLAVCSVAPGTTFQRLYGGKSYDEGRKMLQLNDGSILVAGRVSTTSSNTDIGLLKLDRDGNKVWLKHFGEEETEEANDMILTADGHVLIVGHSDSYSGSPGIKDMWAVKVSAEGDMIWQKNYGTNITIDEARTVVPAHDGGYLLVGNSFVNGSLNIMAIKIDEQGEKQWEKIYGGDNSEEGNAVVKTEDGYTILGNTESKGKGRWDIWLLHIDKQGKEIWDVTFGGGDNETGNALVRTADGGYMIAGSTYSFAEASQDMWLIKTDAQGRKQWANVYGGLAAEEAFGLVQTRDGNFVAVGFKEIWDERNQVVSHLGHDIYMVKVTAKGEKIWERNHGGKDEQRGFDVIELSDQSLMITGMSRDAQTQGVDIIVMKANSAGMLGVESPK